MGIHLDEDTKDIINFVFSKINLSNTDLYFVTSNPISLEDESWLISNKFKFIYEDDLNFIKKMALHFNNENIDPIKIETKAVENIEKMDIVEEKEDNIVKENQLDNHNLEKSLDKIIVDKENTPLTNKITKSSIIAEKVVPPTITKEINLKKENIIKKEDIKTKSIENDPVEEKYIVKNLDIPLYLDKDTLKGEIIETEVRNRQKRLIEFREFRYPSYKVDDYSEINYYKALDIKIPFESTTIPKVKLSNKIFAGKSDIRCNDQIIYGVSIKSHSSDKYQVVDFKNHDFTLRLLLDGDKVMKFFYKISENTVNIKGRNIYAFFRNLFSGLELNFKNKKIEGNFKLISNEPVEKLDIILDIIDKYLSIKKLIKTRDITLKELLKNTRSLEVLFSYYNNVPKTTKGNITIRTNFLGNINHVKKLILTYPISINFAGFIRTFKESTEIKIDLSNMTHIKDKLEVQAFNSIQNITYKEIL